MILLVNLVAIGVNDRLCMGMEDLAQVDDIGSGDEVRMLSPLLPHLNGILCRPSPECAPTWRAQRR